VNPQQLLQLNAIARAAAKHYGFKGQKARAFRDKLVARTVYQIQQTLARTGNNA